MQQKIDEISLEKDIQIANLENRLNNDIKTQNNYIDEIRDDVTEIKYVKLKLFK